MCAALVSAHSVLHAAVLAMHAVALARHRKCNNELTCKRCRSYAKGFGAVGALYAGSECVIEKVPDIKLKSCVHTGCFGAALGRYRLQRSRYIR